MPELPDVEIVRARIADRALGRTVARVEEADPYVCRPHSPQELSDALSGVRLLDIDRRGKMMWLETDGPVLGLHLGMTGDVVIDEEPSPRGWDRFAVAFEDGGRLALRDKRRLGRAVLHPDLSRLGPDAAEIDREEFRRRVGRGTAPIKARLLDQSTLAGVGNLLADEALWRAGVFPLTPAGELADHRLDALRRAIRSATRSAVREGGLQGGRFVPAREPGGHCPRCGAALQRATVGGRTTYWCPRDQKAP